MVLVRSLAAAAALLLVACGGSGGGSATCPTEKDTPCLTQRICERDANGCTRCRCGAPPYVRPASTEPRPTDPR